jgi:hypothetical protein
MNIYTYMCISNLLHELLTYVHTCNVGLRKQGVHFFILLVSRVTRSVCENIAQNVVKLITFNIERKMWATCVCKLQKNARSTTTKLGKLAKSGHNVGKYYFSDVYLECLVTYIHTPPNR